ncbi:MAG TPA: energy transducer TonB [Candidatus Acidoferrales bacterium]|jgi:periplasmic protein TonB|nr:energy transducer TonB [Candidatus Acidoferrales bacterium]
MNMRDGFSQCLVDGDEQSFGKARRIRQRALIASVIFEAALVAALLLWPLITLGKLPRQFFVTPAPPYHGGPNTPPGRSHETRHEYTDHSARFHHLMVQPPSIPTHVRQSSPDEASSDTSGSGFGSTNVPGAGPGGGQLLPGGSDSGLSIPAPPVTPLEKPRPMSEGVMEAALTHRVQPEYPTAAKLMHLQGTVRLRAIIARDGSVSELEVLSGNPILVQAAVAAVREWRYRPTRLNNETVEVVTYITVNFILDQN